MMPGTTTTSRPMLGSDRALKAGRHNRYWDSGSRTKERRNTRRQEAWGRNGWAIQVRRGEY